jgi:class 3 adenylate cyclase
LLISTLDDLARWDRIVGRELPSFRLIRVSGAAVVLPTIQSPQVLSGLTKWAASRRLTAVELPETRFARLGQARVAYQVAGEGPIDLLYVPAMATSVDCQWDSPVSASFLRRLASFSRLITFDRRGCGASDPVALERLPNWEEFADDACAVLDAIGSERAAIFGATDAGPTAILFAAAHPERAHAMILANTTARFLSDDDYPWGSSKDELDIVASSFADMWGTEALSQLANLDMGDDPAFHRWFAKLQRVSCSSLEAGAYMKLVEHTDVRYALASIRIPTLVLHRKELSWITFDQGRYLAEHIPNAKFSPIPGSSITIYAGPTDEMLEQIEEFLTGAPSTAGFDRALASVLFTDIVGSTERAASVGDRRWRDVLESHDALARSIIEQCRGRVIKTTGDGVLATFDGPGRAIRATLSLRDALRAVGIDIRSGLHTGEIELRDNDIGGVAVHVAARVMEKADVRELMVSAAVPMLVTGSGISFEDRGDHQLKGVPGTWRLFSVKD